MSFETVLKHWFRSTPAETTGGAQAWHPARPVPSQPAPPRDYYATLDLELPEEVDHSCEQNTVLNKSEETTRIDKKG